MAAQPVPSSSDPRHLLAATRDLARRVRREQRGAWFPLLVFAAVTFAATPFDRYGENGSMHCASNQGGRACILYSAPPMLYWPVALLLAYAAISWFYIHRSRKLGVGTRVRPYVVVGIVLTVLVTATALWEVAHPLFLAPQQVPYPLRAPLHEAVSPAGTIWLALLLLAWIERSWTLFAVTCVYLIVVHASRGLGWFGTYPSSWFFLPQILLDGGVLLLGGLVLALTQRAQGRPAT